LYANAWFDGFGGWTVPRVTDSELARRCGQALLVLGIVPTLLVLVGVLAALARLRRQGRDDLLGASLLALGSMILIFVIGTRAAPIAAAVKATYFTPVAPAFGVCFALGLARLRTRWPGAVPLVAVELAVTGALAAVVFWHGLLFDARTIRGHFPMIDATEANLQGVVAYAGGERDAARRLFGEAADAGLYLGYENLALLSLDDGRPAEALHLVKRALRLQPAQSFGLAADRADYDRVTRAEYLNLVAVITQQLGKPVRVRRAAAAATRLDPTLPEAHYDLAVAILDAARPELSPTAEVAEACRHLERALTLDPGFGDARALLAATRARSSACATTALPPPASGRLYPVETGIGAPHAASIGRRRHAAPAAGPATPSRQSQT
jgi:tetratricopeptide (TPR) repeat protein